MIVESEDKQWSGPGLVTNAEFISGQAGFTSRIVSSGEMRELEGDDIQNSLRQA